MPRLKRWKWADWADQAQLTHWEDRPHEIAVDTETTGLGFYDEPFAATVTWAGRHGVGLKSWYFELSEPEAYDHLKVILENTPRWIFHNAKFDLQKLKLAELIDDDLLSRVELHDTQTQYMLLDENGRKGLKDLAVRVLHYDDTVRVPYADSKRRKQWPDVYREVSREKHLLDKARRKLGLTKDDGYHLLPREVLVPYALRDTDFTLQLHRVLYPQILAKDDALQQLYRDEIQLQLVLLRMEEDGFALDVPYVEEQASIYGARVMEEWMNLVEMVGDEEFNPNAPAQIVEAFKRYAGTTLPNTQESTLQDLIRYQGPGHALAEALLQYRNDKKMHQTYLLALLREQRDGIIHPNFNPAGARTGRMSSSSAKE